MKTLQVLLLVFVLFGFILVGSRILGRLFNPTPPAGPVAGVDDTGNQKLNPANSTNGNRLATKKPPIDNPVIAPPRAPAAKVGQIRFASDAAFKTGDFWLEQPFELTGNADRAGKQLLRLYAGLDDKTMRGLSVTLSGWEVLLESSESKDGPKKELARQPLAKFPPGEYDMGLLWRRGELSVWVGTVEILKWKPDDLAATAALMKLDSAVQALDENVGIGARRALAFDAIRFDDNFMRAQANDIWRPVAGKWELTAMAFAERSANPFSLRVSFGEIKPFDDPFYSKDQRTRADDYGLGVQLSFEEGTPHIVRITGGSPAAHAGLAEDDIFIEVNGHPVTAADRGFLYRQILYSAGDLDLKMYRPGDKEYRTYHIARDAFKWGVAIEGEPIPPVLSAGTRGTDSFAFVSAGEAGWSDYAAEVAVKPLGTGGFGLAVAAVSDTDYVLFRWRGPAPRGDTTGGKTNVLQLVRVKNGAETVLTEKPATYRPYEFYRMGIDWSGDKIRCLIDKNELLSATIPDVKRGKIGLYALKGDPVFFDDVHVAGNRDITSAWHLAERSINSIFALEDDMEVWANPALEWARDIKTGWAIHNQRFPGEQALTISKPRFNELQVALYCGDDPESAECPRLTIRNGVAELSGAGIEKQKLDVGAGPFQRLGMDASVTGVHAVIDGKQLSAEWRGAKPTFGGPAGRKGGEHIAMRGLKNVGEPSAVHVTSTGTMEYSFDNAPSDWKVLSGRWGLVNKWICDPRWSFFGGRTKTAGAIWNKHIFSGDVSVDAHVALLMVRDDPPFERPGDHNIAICGDGMNLDSGYTLIFGGDINSWTRLYRKGKLVAEAVKEDFRVHSDRIRHPDKPDLHQRWFHLKLEKIGDTVSFYRDGVMAFKFVDPEPLVEGRVAFWTMDNSFLLSRVRIAHGGARAAPFEDGKCALFVDPKAVNLFDGEVPTTITHETLPGEIAAALAAPANGFKPVNGIPTAGGVPPDAAADGTVNAYRVVNGIGGGPFALQFRSRMINIEREGVVRFAYCIEPGAKVDFYLIKTGEADVNPRHQDCFRWRLSGPKEDNSGTLSNEFAPLVGDVPGAIADGKWHAVQFDLMPTWRQFWRRRGYAQAPRLPVRPMFGNLDNTGYLLAGMNGNHMGASYGATEIKTFAAETVDTLPPEVSGVVWPFDAEGDGHSIVVQFNEPGSGIVPETLRVTLNGLALPAELLQSDGSPSFNHATQTLRLGLELAKEDGDHPFLFKDGEKYTLRIAAGFTDRAGNVNTTGFTAAYTYRADDARKANKPVAAPLIAMLSANRKELKPGGYPLSVSTVSALQPNVRLQNSQDAPPWAPVGQKTSLEVVATNELPSMGFQMRNVQYALQNWPYLDLDYKVPQETPFNLHLLTDGGEYHALLLVDVEDGRDNTSADIVSRFGPPSDFVADGTWRHSTIPLLSLFSKTNPTLPPPSFMGFTFHDNGWRGGRRGLHYWIHRVQPVPAGHLSDISVEWTTADVTGIVDIESSVDESPTGDPSGKHQLKGGATLPTSLANTGNALKDGWNYVHVRAKNGAGVWSATAHRKFFLDTTPPRIVKTEPANGGTLASQTIRIFLEEEHGVDLNGTVVRVDGQPVSQFVEYDAVEKVLKFNAMNANMTFAAGKTVTVEVTGLADKFGNAQTKPYTFSFTSAAKAGGPGPEIANLTYHASTERGVYYRQYDMEVSFGLPFEEHFGHVHAIKDCTKEWLNDPAQAAEGRRAMRFTSLQDDGDPQIMLHKNPWFIDRLPLLHFDYKADPGFKVDLQVEVFGIWYSVRFTGAGHAPEGGKAIGAFSGIVADGTWRHASVDLRSLLDAARVRFPDRIVNKIVFSANGEDGCVRGATLAIDNLDMVPPRGGTWRGANGGLKWSVKPSPGDVAGYSLLIDNKAEMIAPETITHRTEGVGMYPRDGVIYAHLRACDQAGNWGPDKTIRLDFGRLNGRQAQFNDDDN